MENDKYIGRLLGGRYELIDVVGVGGMAVVYRARDTILGRYVAIKILKEEFAKDPDIRKRFAIESRAVAKLSHHNIVSVYDVGNEDGTDYIVMELIEGVTLKEYLQQKGRLSWQESIFFAEQISSALVHAHSRGHHPSGHQAAECHHPARRHRKADRFRHRVLRDDAGDARGAGGHRLGALYLAGAGQGQQDRLPHRPVLTRRDDVRNADRQAARLRAKPRFRSSCSTSMRCRSSRVRCAGHP